MRAQQDGHDVVRETVLVVDDDATVRAVICRSLRREGYEVIECARAEEALERAAGPEGRRLRLAVCDVQLPDLNGLVLYGRLRQAQPDMRVLIVSGSGAEELTLPGDPAVVCIRKPFDIFELLARVRSLLGS